MYDIANRRVVMFDFDGTLADTKQAIVETATAALLDFGFEQEMLGDVNRLIGPPFPEAFCQVYGLTQEEAATVTEAYRERYAKLGLAAWPLFEGIGELLYKLRDAGKVVCVATSKLQGVLERALQDEGVSDAFDLAVGKPSDEPFSKEQTITKVLECLGVSAEEAVMVGDRRHDVEGANACGVPCIGVTYGGTGDYKELHDAGAAVVVDTVAQLTELLVPAANE